MLIERPSRGHTRGGHLATPVGELELVARTREAAGIDERLERPGALDGAATLAKQRLEGHAEGEPAEEEGGVLREATKVEVVERLADGQRVGPSRPAQQGRRRDVVVGVVVVVVVRVVVVLVHGANVATSYPRVARRRSPRRRPDRASSAAWRRAVAAPSRRRRGWWA